MEISSILSSSDNLYKFLFMGGIFMIAFAFVYPLEKRQKIELEKNLYNKQVTLLNEAVAGLKKDVHKLKKQSKETIEILETQNPSKERKNHLIDSFNKTFYQLERKTDEINTKSIISEYEKKKINLLEKHIESFNVFHYVFLIVGSAFSVFGIFKWHAIAKMAYRFQQIELSKKERID